MTPRPSPRRRAAAGAVAGFLCAMLMLVAPASATAAVEDPPATDAVVTDAVVPDPVATDPAAADPGDPAAEPTQLSITIESDQATATTGDTLDYTVTVQNLGGADLTDLLVSQTQPAGLTFESADGDAEVQPTQLTWTLDLPKGETATRHSTMSVQSTPDELLRLATVACAATAADQAPLVCSAHSAQLPAGAAAEAAQAAMTAPAVVAEQDRTWWYAGGIAFAVLVFVLVLVLVRRRDRRRGPVTGDDPALPPDSRDRFVDSTQ